jgi:hypothetical protein
MPVTFDLAGALTCTGFMQGAQERSDPANDRGLATAAGAKKNDVSHGPTAFAQVIG